MLNAVRGIVDTAQLHVGNPGPVGYDNIAADPTRRQIIFHPAVGGKMPSSTAQWFAVLGNQTITHVSLWDQHGVFLIAGKLDQPVAVNSGDTFDLDATWLVNVAAAASS